MPNTTARTHIEDVKDPSEIPPPSGDRFFIVLRAEEPSCHVPFTLFDNTLLDRCHGSAIKNAGKQAVRDEDRGLDSRGQPFDCLQHRQAELV